MDNIKNYKCPACASTLIFNADTQNLFCESCGNEYTLESLAEIENTEAEKGKESYDWSSYTPRSFPESEAGALSSYSCPSCSAEITGDAALGATVCPYCGNATIIKKQFEGSLMPDYIIPFRVNKKEAMECFENAAAKAPFLPDEFKSKKKIEEMSGIYLPYWMFDASCDAHFTYSGRRVKCWSDANYNYTKTDYYKLIRGGGISFSGIPVDGSEKTDNTYTEALEPYDYNEAVEFNTAYLSGYLADKYDVSPEDGSIRANERIKNSTKSEFMATTSTFSGVTETSGSVNLYDTKTRYALLPCWMLNIKYEGTNYKYAINGQTGKVVGEYPVCKKKRNRFILKCYAVSLIITTAITLLGAYFMM
ncbi:MAG: hypothetical protein IJD97_06310 [Clostridia bacterium]|nr:hypothetical protein [Clostridia bacterium]